VVVPNLIGSVFGPTALEFAKPLPLGKGRDGEVVKESAVEFGKTVILGEHAEARKKFFRIVLENVLLSGIPAVVITKCPEKYEKMNEPGSHDVTGYEIPPMGFPRRIWRLGYDYFVDLNVVDHAALAEAMGVSTAQKAFTTISEGIKAKKGGIGTLRDVLTLKKEEKFHNLRAKRIVEEVMREHPRYFGQNSVSGLLTMGDVGSATVVAVGEDLWTQTAAQSLLAGLLKFVSRRGKSRKLRAVVFVEDADRITPRVKSPVTGALVRTMAELKDYGIGFVVEAPDEAGVHKDIVGLAETTVRTVSKEEVGVRLLTKRPYRVKLRPLASNLSV